MLKNGVRHCDICDREIIKRYYAVLVPRATVPPNISGLTVDALVRVDMCQRCRNGIGLHGKEMTA